MKSLFLLLLIPGTLFSATAVKLRPYDFWQPDEQERFAEGIRMLTTEITLEELGEELAFTDISKLISVCAMPFDGVIRINTVSGTDSGILEAIRDEFLIRAERARVNSLMDATEEMFHEAEEMRHKVASASREDPEFHALLNEYRGLLKMLQEVIKGKTPEFDYTWKEIQSQPDEGENE